MGVAVAGRLEGVLQSRRARTTTFTATVGAAGVLGAVVSDAAPTGLRSLDELYVGAFAAGVAFFAGSGRRWTWFLPAGVGAAFAADGLALALAAASIAVGAWSVATDSRTRARGALVVGLGMGALLRTDPVGFHGLTALLTAAAVLPVIRSGYQLAARRVRRRVRQVALVLMVPIGLMCIGLALGVLSVYEDLYKGIERIDEGVVAAQNADDDATALRLTEAARYLSESADTLDSWFVRPARALPFVGQNLRAVESLADDAADVADVSALAATSADLDNLRFREGRLDPAVLEGMIVPMENVGRAIEEAQTAVAEVRSPWLVSFISSRMERVDEQLHENLPNVENASEAIRVTKGLLGGNGPPRRYLVLFTTPVEARGRSGFPGNFAELLAENGKVTMVRTGRISELDAQGLPIDQRTLTNPALSEYLDRYGRFEPVSWRNLTMSPDLPAIAQVIKELYPQSGGTGPLDGVMTVDPVGLAALMNFSGDINPRDLEDPTALDEKLTPENTAQFLLHDQYVNFADRQERIDFLGEVAELTFDRLTKNAEMPSPRRAIDILNPVVEGGHIQFTTFNGGEASYFNSIELSGQFATIGNDFVSLVTSNAGGNKIDYYLQRQLRYEAVWDPTTGAIVGKVVATLTNTAPSEGLPRYIIGNDWGLPPGTNRSFVSIYSGYDLEAARIDGQPTDMEPGLEVGRHVYSKFLDIPAGATVTIELDVAGMWAEPIYGINSLVQPMVTPDQLDIAITVAGEDPLRVEGDGVRLEGRTVRWSGPQVKNVRIGIELDD